MKRIPNIGVKSSNVTTSQIKLKDVNALSLEKLHADILARVLELRLEVGAYRGMNDGWSLAGYERELSTLEPKLIRLSKVLCKLD